MKERIFHQTVRYTYAQKAVNAMRESKKHSILEVGAGAHANLAEFLPEDDITFLDLELPEIVLQDERFVIGDATNLKYADESFDFVVALDVVEHIPVEKRALFIENLNRVAKKGVILSAPHFSKKSQHEDELLKSFYILCGKEAPVWIDEHIDCTLPTKDELVDLVKFQGVNTDRIFSFCGVKRELMLKMLIMEAAASRYDEFYKFFEVVNSDYVNSLLFQDMNLQEDDAIKTYVIWAKEDVKNECFDCFCVSDKTQKEIDKFEKKYTELMEWALDVSNLSYSIKVSEGNEKFVAWAEEKTHELNEKTHELDEKTHELNEKTHELNERTHDLSEKTHDLGGKTHELNEKMYELNEKMYELNEKMHELKENEQQNTDNIVKEIKALIHKKNKLNVILITYNHSKFIRQTLETVLMQQTKFDFNVIVADDCSTDNTLEIIKEMEQQSDIPFVYLPNCHNLGIMQNYKRAFAACDAEYVAIMEGDDLWTDELRLQKHVDFLDNHCECAMSFNRYVVKNFEEGTFYTQPRFSATDEMQVYKYISGHDLAYANLIGNFSTSVYRSSALKALPEQIYSIKGYDWLTNLVISKFGYIGCLIQPMSIYRIHSGGTWSGQDETARIQSIIDVIDVYDEFTGREFTAGFTAHKNRLQAMITVAPLQTETTNKAKSGVKVVLKKCYGLANYLPPLVICIVKLIIPPVIREKIVRNI